MISEIWGDEKKIDDNGSPFRIDHGGRYVCWVWSDGRASFSTHDRMGGKGGDIYPGIQETDLRKLTELLAHLPDDFSSFPPPGRRLVLQVWAADGPVARVYDRANAPDSIVEILRLSRSSVRSWVQTFEPLDQWKAHEDSSDGALAVLPDGRQVISATVNGPLRLWFRDSHVMEKEAPISSIPAGGTWNPMSVTGLTISPEGSLAVVEGWGRVYVLDTQTWAELRRFPESPGAEKRYGLSNPHFTPDGKYLLMQSDQPALRIFDTETWQPLPRLQGMPVDALDWFPALSARRSVYLTNNGQVALWNPDEKRDVAVLDGDSHILSLAWSPDESMVAIATLRPPDDGLAATYRIRIWNTENGAIVQELRPFEQKAYSVEGLLWWPDGKYVLGATKSDGFFTSRAIGIWSVQTGRHRGELTGCPSKVFGLGLLDDGRLVAGCGDGVIRVWDTPGILEELTAFDNSLVDERKAAVQP